jgi:hypothetical protein
MARNVTITFEDNSTHKYESVPDEVTPDQIEQRALKDFNKKPTNIAGEKISVVTPTVQPEPQPTAPPQQTPTQPTNLVSQLGQKQMGAIQKSAEAAQKGLSLGGEEIGIAGKQLMSGFKSTPEQAQRLKQIEKEYQQLPRIGKVAKYVPEIAAGVPAAFAVPEVATGAGLATALGLGGLSSSILRPVTKPAEGGKFVKEKLGQFKTGAEETGLGFGVGSAVAAIPGALKAGARAVVGSTQPEITQLAKEFEQMGFEFEPAQLKKDKPIGSPGFAESSKKKNEDLATRLVSNETGVGTQNITPTYVGERLKALGKDYDEIFNRKFDIDTELVKKLQDMKSFEASVDPAGLGAVRSTANNIIDRWNEANLAAQQKNIENRIRNILQQQGRGGVSPIVRLRKDWPTLRSASEPGVPSWMPEVEKTINELSSNLGLKVTPQVWAGTPRRSSLYGMATGDGHIIINDSLDVNGAVATALHEFGHQAEFQLFIHAPQETRQEVINAFRQQMREIPVGVKTVEQHRPITADKYGPESKGVVPTENFERGYLRDFSEWFAEQTSRWITQTKAPTTTVEKFFANVADTWKKIYQRVTGYIPMVQEVDKFFRSNWKGDLIQEALSSGAPQTSAKLSEPLITGEEEVIAKIDGKELQRLRSNMQRIARTAEKGEVRQTAGEFVTAIDDAISRYNPKITQKLRDTNRKYAATATLRDGIEKDFVKGGKVSLQGLGRYLKNNTYGYGSGTSTHPLYKLGYGGEKLNLRLRAEGSEYPYDAITALIGRSKQAMGGILGARSQAARALQKRLSEQEKE